MKRRWELTLAAALGLAPCAMAQFEDKTCLVCDSPISGKLIRNAALFLGFKEVQSVSEPTFLVQLQSQQWDLVGIELASKKVENKALMLSLFEQQAAGSAKFIVSYAHLDEWPELQAFLGVADAKDVTGIDWINEPTPGSPVWFGAGPLPGNNPIWDDHGDTLTPMPGSRIVARFGQQGDGEVAAIVTAYRTRQCHGWNFDEYVNGSPVLEVRHFVRDIMSCEADVNYDSMVDLSDYFQFVNRFNSGDPPANRNYDDAIDLFDFLYFVNAFNDCLP